MLILWIVGIFCLGYFIMYGMFAGFTNTFTYFWLAVGVFSIGLAILSKWLKKHDKAVLKDIVEEVRTIFFIALVAVVGVEAFIVAYGRFVPDENADYMIVLGAQVIGTEPSYNLVQRLDTAYDYLIENPRTIVVLSGGKGSGEEISEAQAMAEYLQKKGISKERMILESKSVNTYENIKYSKKWIKEDKSVVIVTNSFHIMRSVQCAKTQGLKNVQGLGASIHWYTVPNLYLREFFACMYYWTVGKMYPVM